MHWVVYKSLFLSRQLHLAVNQMLGCQVFSCQPVWANSCTSRVFSCPFHLSNGHAMGQRIKRIVLVQRARLFPAWSILHGQRVMLLPFSKSKSTWQGPTGLCPRLYIIYQTCCPQKPCSFSSTSPPGVSSWPLTSHQHGPYEVSGARPHLTDYSHGAHLATVLLCCPKLHLLL